MLSLSTKGRYATRIMIYLALHQDGPPARKQEIADAEGISTDYVEQILLQLKTAGLVKSHRGVKGGFSLSSDPDRVTVADVLAVTEGSTELAPCRKENCARASDCVTRPVWEKASEAIKQTFSGVTIGDLARRSDRQRDTKCPWSFEI
jgi:Rrf2 family protein